MTETETSAEPRSAGEGATGSRRKLTEDQEREVTRLYSETETRCRKSASGTGSASRRCTAWRSGMVHRCVGGRATGGSSGGGTKAASRGTGHRTARPTAGQRHGSRFEWDRHRHRHRTSRTPPTRVEPAAQPAAAGRARQHPPTVDADVALPPQVAVVPPAASTGTGTGRGRRGGARTASAGTTTGARRGRRPGTAASSSGSGRGSASSGGGRSWRVSFTATRVFSAASMADAIRQAEAAGATEIVGIARND